MKNLQVKAWKFARTKHAGQMRDDGEPFASHPYAVAMCLVAMGHNNDVLIAAAYLHDILEDTDTTISELREKFGNDIAEIVEQLTFKRKKDENFNARSIRMADDLEYAAKEVKLIKLSDRLHNLQTMSVWPEWKQKRYKKVTCYLLRKMGEVDFGLHLLIMKELNK